MAGHGCGARHRRRDRQVGAGGGRPRFFRTDFLDGSSARYGSRTIDDYAASSTATRASYDGRNHRQAGDPAKLGAALVLPASDERPPVRYAAGSDAVELIARRAAALREELERWRELSVSTDLVPEAA